MKRRIIGAIVLVVLFILSISFFYSRNDHSAAWHPKPPPSFFPIEVEKISPPAQFDAIKKKLDKLKDNAQPLAKTNQGRDKNHKLKDNINKNALDDITFDDNSIPVRWVVQVASFNLPEQADKLKQHLADNNFKSLTRKLKSSKGDIVYVVYVGPFLQLSRAENNKLRLKTELKFEGILRKWQ